MAFKIADPKNDKARHVVRKNRYRLSDFWRSGEPGEGFVITGGKEDEQIWGLYHAVEDYIRRKQRPVVILHNNRNLDGVLQQNLLLKFPGLRYERVGGKRRNYMPFDGMSKRSVVTCMKNQCRNISSANELAIGQYMDSLISILEEYKTSNALCYISQLCSSSDEEIIDLAQRADVDQITRNGIQMNTNAGMEVREMVKGLKKSFSEIYSGREGDWINIGRFVKQGTGNRVLSLYIGGADTDKMLMALRDELILLNNNEFLLVMYDITVNEKNGIGELLGNTQNRFTLGICSAEVAGMFSGNAVEYFGISRARIKKWMILSYSDARAASRISDLFASYMMEQTVEVRAPKKPWQLVFAKAPGKARVKMEVLEPGEICEIGYQNAILYGHSGVDIMFVTKQLDYSVEK
ncbi:MAG: hypothetical protein SOY73_10090 [Blautia sp.]|nr:hypothetical protein [Blautia sp.]MDY3999422.1 hypothetical protein [Blautia sp.]